MLHIIGAAVPLALQQKDIRAIGQARMADEEAMADMLDGFKPGEGLEFDVLVDVWPEAQVLLAACCLLLAACCLLLVLCTCWVLRIWPEAHKGAQRCPFLTRSSRTLATQKEPYSRALF